MALPGGRYGLWAVEEVAAVGHDPDKAEESSKRDKKPLRPATDERGHQKDEKRHHHARHDGYPGCLDYALRGERVGEHVPHASSGSVTGAGASRPGDASWHRSDRGNYQPMSLDTSA